MKPKDLIDILDREPMRPEAQAALDELAQRVDAIAGMRLLVETLIEIDQPTPHPVELKLLLDQLTMFEEGI
jgi:hypothetical protein